MVEELKNSLTPALSKGEGERTAAIIYSSNMQRGNVKGKDNKKATIEIRDFK